MNTPLPHPIAAHGRLRALLFAAIFLSHLGLVPSSFGVESPLYLPFQGQVTNQAGAIVADGQYSVIFNLYDQAVGGQPIWSERHVKVGVTRGMINVFLGSITALAAVDFAQSKYLGITVDVDNLATTADPEMVPRSLIIPAFHAKNTDRLQGFTESAILPPGTVLPYAGATAPAGFLLCDGTAVSRTTYARLFAAIQTTYGSDNSATFKVPDMRGRVAVGAGQGLSLTNRILATQFGSETHTLTLAQMPSHNHGGTTSTQNDNTLADAVSNRPLYLGGAPGVSNYGIRDDLNANSGSSGLLVTRPHTHTIPNAGSDSPHPIVQPSIALNYVIKY